MCVVCIHVFEIGARRDLIGQLGAAATLWAVPAFLFVSGFLHSRVTPYLPGQFFHWFRRLLPTYAVATCLALLYRRYELQQPVGVRDVVVAFFAGSGWGIYYFVPILIGVLCVSVVLARYPKIVFVCAAIFLPALFVVRWKWGIDPMIARWGTFGMFRSPFFWWGYFIAGWVAAPVLRAHPEAGLGTKLVLAAMAVASIGALYTTSGWQFSATRALLLAGVPFVVILSVFVASSRAPSGVIRRLSDDSYGIYLWHIFVADLVTRRFAMHHAGIVPGAALAALAILCAIAAERLTGRLLAAVSAGRGLRERSTPSSEA